jgi:proteasome lid subunit RPN8/RPN11
VLPQFWEDRLTLNAQRFVELAWLIVRGHASCIHSWTLFLNIGEDVACASSSR